MSTARRKRYLLESYLIKASSELVKGDQRGRSCEEMSDVKGGDVEVMYSTYILID